MRKSGYGAVITVAFLIFGASSVYGQEPEEYTIVPSDRGPQVCIGRWVPPTDVAKPGVCEGQLVGLPQLTAVSARQSVERLDQLADILTSIDQRLAVNNDRLNQLIEDFAAARTATDQQIRRADESLSAAMDKRFEALPGELLNNEQFREELMRLKKDILEEIEKRPAARTKPASK